MTENDLSVARDIGSLQSDVRTIKHDVAGMSSKIDGLSNQIGRLSNVQARGLGFFAGVAFILTASGGILIAVARLVFGGQA